MSLLDYTAHYLLTIPAANVYAGANGLPFVAIISLNNSKIKCGHLIQDKLAARDVVFYNPDTDEIMDYARVTWYYVSPTDWEYAAYVRIPALSSSLPNKIGIAIGLAGATNYDNPENTIRAADGFVACYPLRSGVGALRSGLGPHMLDITVTRDAYYNDYARSFDEEFKFIRKETLYVRDNYYNWTSLLYRGVYALESFLESTELIHTITIGRSRLVDNQSSCYMLTRGREYIDYIRLDNNYNDEAGNATTVSTGVAYSVSTGYAEVNKNNRWSVNVPYSPKPLAGVHLRSKYTARL